MTAEHNTAAHPATKEFVTDVFVRGAVQGWNVGIKAMVPNVLMAFVLIKALKITGLLDLIGNFCGPVMGIFGLPGEAITILFGAWMSMGGGVGVAVALFEQGAVTGNDLAIVAPAIFLMGSQVQYLGRCLGVIGVEGKMLPLTMAVPIVVAVISMLVMKLIVLVG